MVSRTLCILFFLLGAFAASGQELTISDVEGASHWDTDSTSGFLVIYGGTAGDSADCVETFSDGTCDNCTNDGANLKACNFNRILDTTTLKITFTMDGDFSSTGYPTMAEDDTDGTNIYQYTAAGAIGSNQSVTFEMPWTEACSSLGGSSGTCDGITVVNNTVRLGIDQNGDGKLDSTNDPNSYGTLQITVVAPEDDTVGTCTTGVYGVCDFEVFPGDEKVFFTPFSSTGDDTLTTLIPSVTPHAVVVMYSSNTASDFNSVAPNATTTTLVELPLDSNGDIVESFDGLDNGTMYYFKAGVMDKARNIGYFTDDSAITTVCGTAPGSFTGSTAEDDGCDYIATPDVVLGLLEDDVNCFITTAAYGSPLHEKVQTFREFRNKVLLQWSWGKHFVRWYYKEGPKAAAFIAENDHLRGLAQMALWPLWLVAWLGVHLGLGELLLVLSSLLLISGLWVLRKNKKAKTTMLSLSVFAFLYTPFNQAKAQYDYYSNEDMAEEYSLDEEEENKEEPSKEEINDLPDLDSVEAPTPQTDEPVPIIRREGEGHAGPTYEGGKRYINHPMAEKGLIYIDREKVHYYEVEPSEESHSATLRLGFFDPTELTNSAGEPFSLVYSNSNKLMVMFDYEWHIFSTSLGQLNLTAGTGIYTAQGTGRFESINNADLSPRENFTFFAFPNHASALFRFQFWDEQRFVPYGLGGVDYFAFAERRDDDKNPDIGAKIGGALATHFAGGLAISLASGGSRSFIQLDREYGINQIWLTTEYRQVIGLNDTFDFSSQIISAGLMVDY